MIASAETHIMPVALSDCPVSCDCVIQHVLSQPTLPQLTLWHAFAIRAPQRCSKSSRPRHPVGWTSNFIQWLVQMAVARRDERATSQQMWRRLFFFDYYIDASHFCGISIQIISTWAAAREACCSGRRSCARCWDLGQHKNCRCQNLTMALRHTRWKQISSQVYRDHI